MAKAAPIGKKMVEAGLDLLSPKHCFLTSYILQERRNVFSKWRFFLEILPKTMENFPIFFSAEEEALLEGSPFLEQVKDKRRDIEKDYETIAEVAPELREWTLREFSEVRMMVSSRIFGMNIEGQKTDGFVPMADMLNHKRPRETSWTYTDEKVGFVIEACMDIPRNNQIFDSYGKKCNSRFFLNYGFIVENNDGNEVPIKVALRGHDPLLALKKQLLADGATTAPPASAGPDAQPFRKFRVSEDMRARTTRECLSFLRYTLYEEKVAMLYQFQSTNTPPAYALNDSDEDSDDDKDDTSFKATNIPAVSISNERTVLLALKELCLECLAKYPTTFQEDLEILEHPPPDLDFSRRNCVLMRSGEKQVLHFLISVADLFMAILASGSTKVSCRLYNSGSEEGLQSGEEELRRRPRRLLQLRGPGAA